ncbi:DUF4142 domain-containing protein [Halopseudomonas sp.]|uniref:DUF4142 domain-containing protein n=1 Tax=Halopseudomonas sp. TaxID=2901191 RepID=UPI00356A2602
MKTIQTLTSAVIAGLLSIGAVPTMADDDTMTGTDMGDATRTPGPTGTPATTGQGGSASRAGMVTEPNYPQGVSAVTFIEEASEKNYTIINAAELALEKESGVAEDPQVREFAQQMIEEHRRLNHKLTELAAQEQLEVSGSAALMDRAQRLVLEVREGDSFLEVYANNQVADHQALIDLYERMANTEDGEVSRFAQNALAELEEHLELARDLHPQAHAERD